MCIRDSIYGSRAANGVVVVTTKAPEEGKLRVSYNMNMAINAPDLSDYNLMNARQKLEAEVASGMYEAEGEDFWFKKIRIEEYQGKLKNVREGVNTYWLAKPLRTEFNHKHSLYLEGGNEEFRYGIDLGYNNENGVMKGSYRDRIDVYKRQELILQGKDFDLLVLPGQGHGYDGPYKAYFEKKKRDYFTKYLLNK